jgi:muramoyltetrapeptide carboxypeptidase
MIAAVPRGGNRIRLTIRSGIHFEPFEAFVKRQGNVVPPPLRPGDTVAVLSPAGPVDAAALNRGQRFLEERGYRVRRGRHALARRGYLAGSDRQRLTDLNRAIADPGVQAVFFSRGGYGTTRLLPGLDLGPLCRLPKIFLGFSDLTVLLNRITAEAGLVTYLGPMVATDLNRGLSGRTLTSFETMIEGRRGGVLLRGTPGRAAAGARKGFLRTGTVSAELAGGCLSMIVASLGTDNQPELAGKILFWEDVNEPAYRLDRMLTQLRQAGLFDDLAGMIIGGLSGCGTAHPGGRGGVQRFLDGVLGPLRCPVYFGFPSGHGPAKVILPIGLPVTLDSGKGQVRYDRLGKPGL